MVILQISMSSEWRREKIKVITRSSNSSASPLKSFNVNPNLLSAAAGKNLDDSTVSKSPKRGYKIGIPMIIQSRLEDDGWQVKDHRAV
jgi:hypothetical protein